MPTNAKQLEPSTNGDFVGMIPIQTRKGSEVKERVVSWPQLVNLMSKPTWVSEHRLEGVVHASECAGDDLADLTAELDVLLPPPPDPRGLGAAEWRPMPWSASHRRRDPENGRYSIVSIDVPPGHSLEQLVDRLSHLRAIVHSRYMHSPGQPLWRVIVAADPPLTDKQVQTLHKFFSWDILGVHSLREPGGDPFRLWYLLPASPSGAQAIYTAVHIQGRPIDAAGWSRGSNEAAPVVHLARPLLDDREVGVARAMLKPTGIGDAPTAATCAKSELSSPHAAASPPPDDVRDVTEEPVPAVPPSGVDARAALADLVAEYNASGDYASIRSRYLALHLRVNEARAWAPAFRPRLAVPRLVSKQEPKHLEIHRDQVVIDCHWLRCTGSPVYPRDESYEPLFDPETPFNEDLARSFAEEPWRKRHKVDEALALTPFQQAQLGTLESAEIMTRRRHALRGTGAGARRISARMSTFRRCMNRWCERDPRMREHREMYEALWLARELLGDEALADQLAQLATLKIGRGAAPLTAGTVRDKLRKLDRQFAAMGAA